MLIRESKRNEIAFLVDAFENTLKEIDTEILPTKKTLTCAFTLLYQSYDNGVPSFVIEDNGYIIGCLPMISDSLMMDMKHKSCYALTVYIDPIKRHKNLANKLIMFAWRRMAELGFERVSTALAGIRYSPKFLAQCSHKKILNILFDISQ